MANVSRKYRNGAFVAFRGSWNRDHRLQNVCSLRFNPATTKTFLPVSCLTQLSRPLGETSWLTVLPRRLTEEANNRITASNQGKAGALLCHVLPQMY